jgi:hypothetical protein
MADAKKTNGAFDVEEYYKRMEIAKAPAWLPESGAVMMGEVIGLSMRESGYGPYPCVTYRKLDDQAVVNVHAFHTMLRQRLAELKTDIGSRHVITYTGLREKSQPNPKGEKETYHDYYVEDMNVVVEQAAAKPEGFTFV